MSRSPSRRASLVCRNAAGLIGVACAGVFSWILLPFAVRKLGERRLSNACARHGLLVLTYDDGPGTSEMTARLLEVLAEWHARATFFMIGRDVAARPTDVLRVLEAGHEVGSHSHQHLNAWKTDPVRTTLDVATGVRAIDEAGGTGRLFRPPFGKVTLASLLHAWLTGLRFAWWTIDSRDSWNRRPIDSVIAEVRQKGGGVLLMHDSGVIAGAADDHGDHVIELTRQVLEFADRSGLRVVTLSQVKTDSGSISVRK